MNNKIIIIIYPIIPFNTHTQFVGGAIHQSHKRTSLVESQKQTKQYKYSFRERIPGFKTFLKEKKNKKTFSLQEITHKSQK